jgi:Mrp family chromosome partitioning ATPase
LAGLDLYLINQATIEDIIVKTSYPNLDFIHNGKIPHDPVALLSSPRLPELFEYLKSEYDYIIIDTPPFGLVSDAFLLMKFADIILYVSRLGTVMKKPLKQCMEELTTKEIKNVYLIRNDLAKIDRTYYDKYAYGEVKKGIFSRIFKSKKKKKAN